MMIPKKKIVRIIVRHSVIGFKFNIISCGYGLYCDARPPIIFIMLGIIIMIHKEGGAYKDNETRL